MKKKIILVVAVLAILITLICIPKTTYQKWFGKTPNDNPVDTNKEYQTIFVVDEKNKLVGLKVPVEEIEEDQIAQKWNLLTSQMNKIPQGYSSPITPSTVLNDYKIEDNKLILNVSEDILRSSGRLAIESLAWTFCNDEIKEVVLRVDENVVNLISDYQFNKISWLFIFSIRNMFISNNTNYLRFQSINRFLKSFCIILCKLIYLTNHK